MSTFLPDEYAEVRPETVGFTAPPVEVDLRDVDPASGVGELLIRGQNVVAGYWNKPEQTAETFVDGGCTPATSPASTTRGSCRSSTA